jgi:hypothetical protein
MFGIFIHLFKISAVAYSMSSWKNSKKLREYEKKNSSYPQNLGLV